MKKLSKLETNLEMQLPELKAQQIIYNLKNSDILQISSFIIRQIKVSVTLKYTSFYR